MIYCLIPAKPYFESKTRLAPLLSSEQRAILGRWLLLRTIRLAKAVIEHVVVVSRDRALLADAKAQGAWGLLETTPGLNPALTQGARFAQARGAEGLLVLPTDLPRLTIHDLETILTLGVGAGLKPAPTRRVGTKPITGTGVEPATTHHTDIERASTPTMVIAPCRHRTGTNILLLRPPDLIRFAFGPDSFAAHCTASRTAGAEPIIYRADNVAFDLDTPEDWRLGIKD
jgi:2-phospho-L-lactate guanylyltransferase (CobY/MobA/RfbA family)